MEKEKSRFSASTTLKNYINRTIAEHSTEAFALATNFQKEIFCPDGIILITSFIKKLPENFAELFQQHLLSDNVLVKIDLVGNNMIGFISDKNCIRIAYAKEDIAIQLKAVETFSLSDIAKIGVAAIKAASNQKNVTLHSFPHSELYFTIQKLLQKEGFLIEYPAERV